MTKPQTNLLSGTYVVGHFLGYEEKAWANDATKYNRRIGIKTSEYETSFGQVGSNVQLVDIQSGNFQGSCTFSYAANNTSFCGFSATAPQGRQFRVWPDHRLGFAALAS